MEEFILGTWLKQIEFSDRKTHSFQCRASGVLGGALSDVPKLLNPDLDKGWIWTFWISVYCSWYWPLTTSLLNSWDGEICVLPDTILERSPSEFHTWGLWKNSFQIAIGDLQMDVNEYAIPVWKASLMASFRWCSGTFHHKSWWKVGLPFTRVEWTLTGMHGK